VILPKECDTNEQKAEYLYRCEEKLRLLHNEYGAAARAGKMSMEDFRAWQTGKFQAQAQEIHAEINKVVDKGDTPYLAAESAAIKNQIKPLAEQKRLLNSAVIDAVHLEEDPGSLLEQFDQVCAELAPLEAQLKEIEEQREPARQAMHEQRSAFKTAAKESKTYDLVADAAVTVAKEASLEAVVVREIPVEIVKG